MFYQWGIQFGPILKLIWSGHHLLIMKYVLILRHIKSLIIGLIRTLGYIISCKTCKSVNLEHAGIKSQRYTCMNCYGFVNVKKFRNWN